STAVLWRSFPETPRAPAGLRTSSILSPSLRPSSRASGAGIRTARLLPHLATFMGIGSGYTWIYKKRKYYECRDCNVLKSCTLLEHSRRRFCYIGEGVGALPFPGSQNRRKR